MGWLDALFRTRLLGPRLFRPKASGPAYDPDADLRDDGAEGELAVALEITDVLDLHSFPPPEVKDVVRSYLDEASERGFRQIRIIHGRGKGVQRRLVRSLLERDPRVESFGDADLTAGGWGATVAQLVATPSADDPP